MVNSPEFFNFLNSFSNRIAFKILKVYSENKIGLNLTDTSMIINEKTSTVKDHLKKLLNAKLIFKSEKLYYLSNFGSYILNILDDLEILNKTSIIFGQIDADFIPSEYISELLPFLKNIPIITNQWQFITISNRMLNQIKAELGNRKIEIKVLGWNSLALGMEIIQNTFNEMDLNNESIKNLLNEINLELITDKNILKDVENNELINNMIKNPEIKERFQIADNIGRFRFIMMRYNEIIHFFLNEKEEFGIGPYFLIENEPGAVEVFDKIFNFFSIHSKPLAEFLKIK